VLISRLQTAAILLSVVFAFIYLDVAWPLAGVPGLWMLGIYLVLCVGTAQEAIGIVRNAWQIPVYWSTWIVVASCSLAALPELLRAVGLSESLPSSWALPAGRLAIVCIGNWLLTSLMGFMALRTYQDSKQALGWLVSIGLLMYVSVSTSFWWILRQIGEPKQAMLNIIGVALVTKMADSGAYFAGKNFGRRPLAPVLSPKKTWEGLIGGWIAAVCAAVVFFIWIRGSQEEIAFEQQAIGAILLGTALTWFGLLGDLLESMLKRSGNVKDSGSSFAGLGGVWDVTDSLIPAGVIGLIASLLGWI
jgi:phosphatidate cytidylyltransferase